METETLKELFGKNVFSLSVMKEKLPKKIYRSIKDTIKTGRSLDPEIADVIANALKDWAIEKGATHYTHWFHPMTGKTAQKLDSFIEKSEDGMILELSGKSLIQGEPDASSFPNGGLRATFEARGYTAWDVTSFAFIRKQGSAKTLYIPTAFYSYTEEALDEKIPLLKSTEVLNQSLLRLLNLLGDKETTRIITNVGAEQEYFLVDKKYLAKRSDLLLSGRTLFGALPPKGQELDDHYFSSLNRRVASFMSDLDRELWQVGIMAKTKHNEVAPTQYEIVPIYESVNLATDQNHLMMDLMKKVADKNNFYCLLHEKPYKGINGSGKHNNWSISTDKGENLLDPGKTPHKNLRFLLILSAIIKGIDEYPELLRVSVANAGNDHRLGANEAPPAIISIFLGDKLSCVLRKIENDEIISSKKKQDIDLGIRSIMDLPKDDTDRNRTSPFAFTGNKFEFRAVPSSGSIALPNIVLNTITANAIDNFYELLKDSSDLDTDIINLVKDVMKKHKRVLFNGDGYSEGWVEEAQRRGLPNLKTTFDAIPYFNDTKAIELFKKYSIFTKNELDSRAEIMLDSYSKHINIEAKIMISMTQQDIIPAVINYTNKLANSINSIQSVSSEIDTTVQNKFLKDISTHLSTLHSKLVSLKMERDDSYFTKDPLKQAESYKNLLTAMDELRDVADKLELIVAKEDWPFPTYEDLLFRF